MSAAATRVVFFAVTGAAAIVVFNAGMIPVRSAVHGSGVQAVIDSTLLALMIGLGFADGVLKRRKGRTHREVSVPGGRLIYDKWFFLAGVKPWAVLLVIANGRALCHFYAPGAAGSAEVLVYAAGAATVVWLFVVGPVRRPMSSVMVLADPTFLDGRSWPGDGRRHSRTREDEP